MVRPKISPSFLDKINLKIILLVSIIFRLFLLPFSFHDDTLVNYWWGKFAVDFPLRGYYDWLNFGGYVRPDQPVLYVLFYRTIRQLYEITHSFFWYLNVHIPAFPSLFMQWYFLKGNLYLEKLVISLVDILFIYLIFRFVSVHFTRRLAYFAAILFSFYPPLVYNTAVWGGNDSLVNLLGLSGIYLLYNKKYLTSSLLIASCFLFKTSLIIFTPLILVILIKNHPNIKNIISFILPGLILSLVLAFPFSTYSDPLWLLNLYLKTVLPGAMSQLTSNAMNLWALLYGLVPRLDELKVVGNITARQLSLSLSIIFILLISVKLYRQYSLPNLLLSLVQTSLITFLFMTRMHERYTFPALIPLFLLCFYDKSFIKYFILLSVTHMLNVYNLWWVPRIPFLITFLSLDITPRIISLINLVLGLKLLTKNVDK